MKMTKNLVIAAVLLACGTVALGSCQGNTGISVGDDTVAVAAGDTGVVEKPLTVIEVVDNYLAEEFGKQYSQADVCIPFSTVVATDENDEQDIKVWGDFWVFNYSIAGDTLKTASGGSHPGLIHLKETASGYDVTSFDQVGDGSRFDPTARKIFGEHYEAFRKINSNGEEREKLRAKGIAEYVNKHGIKATMYQDYGWPAVKL